MSADAGGLDTPGFFVSGTDTGAGKTVAACGLVRALRARGIDAGAMKPIETGVGDAGPLDALALQAAAGGTDRLEDVCPIQFPLPAAANVAAAHAGRSIDLDLIREAFDRLAARHAVVIVEGAGGLLAPCSDHSSMADLAKELGLPLILVARSALGTINHTRLCLEAAASRNLPVVGVVVSHTNGPLSEADAANFEHLRESLGEDLIGEIPPLAEGEEVDPSCFDLGPLIARLR